MRNVQEKPRARGLRAELWGHRAATGVSTGLGPSARSLGSAGEPPWLLPSPGRSLLAIIQSAFNFLLLLS